MWRISWIFKRTFVLVLEMHFIFYLLYLPGDSSLNSCSMHFKCRTNSKRPTHTRARARALTQHTDGYLNGLKTRENWRHGQRALGMFIAIEEMTTAIISSCILATKWMTYDVWTLCRWTTDPVGLQLLLIRNTWTCTGECQLNVYDERGPMCLRL